MLDSLAEQLLEKIKADEQARRRLFIDGIEGFRAASVYPDRMPRFLSAFCNQLRTLDVTAVVSEELPLFRPEIDMPNPELANVVETVILLRYVELRSQLYRLISIMKMRESRYDTSIREFRITDDGLEVAVVVRERRGDPHRPRPVDPRPARRPARRAGHEDDPRGGRRVRPDHHPPRDPRRGGIPRRRPAPTAGRPSTASRSDPPDLVLMDVMMPLLSGLEVLWTMKQTPGLDGMPVVLMSASGLGVKRRTTTGRPS